jgi:hypothetical protein
MLDREIKGVARKTAEAFYEIGIRGLADLHEYLVEHTDQQVLEALRAQGVTPISNWIERYDLRDQARTKALQVSAVQRSSKEVDAVAKEAKETPSHAASCQQHDAAFSLLFDYVLGEDGKEVLQTTVYDEKSLGEEKVFEGTDTVPWINWILARAHLPVPTVPEPTSAMADTAEPLLETAQPAAIPEPPTPPPARIEILGVNLKRSPDRTEQILIADVSFGLTGAGTETLVEQEIPFEVIVHLADLPSGPVHLVASERGRFEEQRLEYSSQLTFPIPDLGRYELQCVVLVLPPGEQVAFHTGPTINVVP